MRGSGRVKSAKFKRVWFRVPQNPRLSDHLVERTFTNDEGKDFAVGRENVNTTNARNSKTAKTVRVILADHKQAVKEERKRLKNVVTLQDSYDRHNARHGEQ